MRKRPRTFRSSVIRFEEITYETTRAGLADQEALAAGLVLAAGVLAPWRLHFSCDARDIYWRLNAQAKKEAAEDTLGWLATVGFTYEEVRCKDMEKVLVISRMSAALGVVMIVQTLLWILVLGLG